MKRMILLTLILACGLWPAKAEAVILTDLVIFPTPTAVTDTLSGNQINFTFQHSFSELETSGLNLLSGTLTLTHLGNANNEPTNEAWTISSISGVFIGKLSESNSAKKTDSWELPQNILNEIKQNSLWKLDLGLSEITSFNSEKIELYQSELKVDYEIPPPMTREIPSTPEPSTILLMLVGFLLSGFKSFFRS